MQPAPALQREAWCWKPGEREEGEGGRDATPESLTSEVEEKEQDGAMTTLV